MKRARLTPPSAGPLALAVASCLLLHAAKPEPIADLSLTTLDGKHARLRDYRGKVVVLNFWATWCGPCKAEMPIMAAMESAYGPKGVTFVGVSLDEKQSRRAVPEFLAKFGVTYPNFVGGTGDDLAKLGLGEAVPATAFVTREGVIFARVEGEIRRAEIEERLDWVLGDRAGPAPAPLVRHLPR